MTNYKIQIHSWEQVRITPRAVSYITSRKQVDTSSNLFGLNLSVPVIAPAMNSLISQELINNFERGGGAVVQPRDSLFTAKRYILNASLTTAFGRAKWLYENVSEGPMILAIELNNGYLAELHKVIFQLRKEFGPRLIIWAGAVCTAEGCQLVAEAGADAALIGIGTSCLAGDTRILMSNGTYKNISDINVGDSVINGAGIPTAVIGKTESGIRPVIKLKHTNGFDTLVTPEHNYFGGNFGDLSKDTVSSYGYTKSIRRYGWVRADEPNNVLLFPKNIKFILPSEFTIRLDDYSIDKTKLVNYHETVTPDYDLGYIFGTFLGDGTSRIVKCKNSWQGDVTWVFNKTEGKIADKLQRCIGIKIGKQPKIINRNNTLIVALYSKQWAHIFAEFGKKVNKHLPEKYYCDNKPYLEGILDGLIDSDGSLDVDRGYSIVNTSKYIIELVQFCHLFIYNKPMMINGRLMGRPSTMKNGHTIIPKSKVFAIRQYKSDYRITDDYHIVKRLGIEDTKLWVPTYDIQVRDGQSFIANNVIVHNSVCETTTRTGVGLPSVATLLDCENSPIPKILLGGIRQIGHIPVALALGADLVMVGHLLKNCKDVAHPGDYWGQASATQKGHREYIEGRHDRVDIYDMTSEDLLLDIKFGIQSACSFVGATNINEFTERVELTYLE